MIKLNEYFTLCLLNIELGNDNSLLCSVIENDLLVFKKTVGGWRQLQRTILQMKMIMKMYKVHFINKTSLSKEVAIYLVMLE